MERKAVYDDYLMSWTVIDDTGKIWAMFSQGSNKTMRKHAERFANEEFDREEYEEDLKVDYNWTGLSVLAGLVRKRR